jgi:hypothetical protein
VDDARTDACCRGRDLARPFRIDPEGELRLVLGAVDPGVSSGIDDDIGPNCLDRGSCASFLRQVEPRPTDRDDLYVAAGHCTFEKADSPVTAQFDLGAVGFSSIESPSEVWSQARLGEAGIDVTFVQDNVSLSTCKGVVRGLHFQAPPAAQAKLVRVSRGGP